MYFPYIRQKRWVSTAPLLLHTKCLFLQTPWPPHLQVHGPGHDQRGHQQVGHSQADHQVVGGGLKRTLPQHSQTHQHVSKHDGQDEQRVQHGVIVTLILPRRLWALIPLIPPDTVCFVPEPFCTAKHRHGGVPLTWEVRCWADLPKEKIIVWCQHI